MKTKPGSTPVVYNPPTDRKWATLETGRYEAILQTPGPNDSESDTPFSFRVVDKRKIEDVHEEPHEGFDRMFIAAFWWLIKHSPTKKGDPNKRGPKTLNEAVADDPNYKMMSEFDKEDWDAYSKAFD